MIRFTITAECGFNDVVSVLFLLVSSNILILLTRLTLTLDFDLADPEKDESCKTRGTSEVDKLLLILSLLFVFTVLDLKYFLENRFRILFFVLIVVVVECSDFFAVP